jgi:Lrp/AsnC family transcriptional regulator, leucine-responsive regulatory protein
LTLTRIEYRVFQIDGVTGTQTIVVLETFFERPLNPCPDLPAANPET